MNFDGVVERETGIEPATNGLGSRYSTIELLPLDIGDYTASVVANRRHPNWFRCPKRTRQRAMSRQ